MAGSDAKPNPRRRFRAILGVILLAGLALWAGPYIYYFGFAPDDTVIDSNVMEFAKTGSSIVVLVLGAGFIREAFDLRDRERRRAEDELQFLRSVLADLKSAYDQVDSARTLIIANFEGHREGQMPHLISASVTLRNVKRALRDRGTQMSPVLEQELRLIGEFLDDIVDRYRTYFGETQQHRRDTDRFWTEWFERSTEDERASGKPDPISKLLEDDLYAQEFRDRIDNASRHFRARYMDAMR